MTRIELSGEKFNDFIRCLTNLKDKCNDVDIKDGFIRQRSNDLTSVFEMDLTSLIETATIPLSNIKNKLELFKTFVGQDIVIDIVEGATEDESYYTVADTISSIKFNFPLLEFMDNKYMSQEELYNIFDLNDEDLILNTDLVSSITEKIKTVAFIFNTPAIQIKFNNSQAAISAATQSKDQYAVFKKEIEMNMEFTGNYSSNLSTIPFTIEHDNKLVFKMYKDPTQNVSLNKISSTLGDVNINIYSRSAIMEESGE